MPRIFPSGIKPRLGTLDRGLAIRESVSSSVSRKVFFAKHRLQKVFHDLANGLDIQPVWIGVTDRIVVAVGVVLTRSIPQDGIGLGEAAYTPS